MPTVELDAEVIGAALGVVGYLELRFRRELARQLASLRDAIAQDRRTSR